MSFSDPIEDPERRMSWSASARPLPKSAMQAAVEIREQLEEKLIDSGHITREELETQKETIRRNMEEAASHIVGTHAYPNGNVVGTAELITSTPDVECPIVLTSKSFARTPTPTQKQFGSVSEHFGAEMEAKGQKMVEVGRQMQGYAVKDSGERKQFASGMVRDTNTGKVRYDLAFDGPMFERYAEHLTKGAEKYAARNWMQANGEEELERFRESAVRHFILWLRGIRDEDHAAAVWYNINGFEYVRDRLIADGRLKEGPNATA